MVEPYSRKEMRVACIRNKVDSSCMDSRFLTSYMRNVLLGLQNHYMYQCTDSSGVAKALTTTAFEWGTYHYLPQRDVEGLPGFIWGKLEEGKVGQLWEVSDNSDNSLKLFTETVYRAVMDLWPLPPEKSKKDIFLFFKLCNP